MLIQSICAISSSLKVMIKKIYQPSKTAELLGSKNVNQLISCILRKVSGFSKRVYPNLFSKSDSNVHK